MARVQIVDDSPIMRKTLKTLVEKAGHKVVAESPDGLHAYVDYESFKPDIITLDVTMPLLDGIETSQKILSTFPEAKIVIISAEHQEERIKFALEIGVANYIVKPITLNKIILAFGRILNEEEK